jgi:hypothetical protein
MSEDRKWLGSTGLAQYGDAFETDDLDIDLLGRPAGPIAGGS